MTLCDQSLPRLGSRNRPPNASNRGRPEIDGSADQQDHCHREAARHRSEPMRTGKRRRTVRSLSAKTAQGGGVRVMRNTFLIRLLAALTFLSTLGDSGPKRPPSAHLEPPSGL
jgi:hypothetical protein